MHRVRVCVTSRERGSLPIRPCPISMSERKNQPNMVSSTRRAGAGQSTPGTSAGERRSAAADRTTPDRIVVVGVVLIAAATCFRAWAASRTWFYVDDFPLVLTAAHDGLAVSSLLDPYIGHVMPAGRIAALLTTVGRPFDYGIAIAELAVRFALAGAGLLRLLRTLFGSHPGVLLLLAYFLFSPWLIQPTSWWAAGINHLPALVATVWTLDAVVRYLRDPQRRHLVASVAWMAFGLAFAELALLAYIPVALVSVGYFASGSLPRRVLHLCRKRRWLVMAHGVVVAAYACLYLATAWAPQDAPEGGVPWGAYVTNVLGIVVPSASIGGPVRWNQVWAAQFETDPSGPLQLAGLVAVAGVVALSVHVRDRALRAWSIPVVQLVALVVLIAKTRVVFGPAFILDLRFTTPLALGIPLAIGLAFLPVRGAVESSSPRRPHWLIGRPSPVVLSTAVVVALGIWSAVTFPLLHVPVDQSPRRYFATFERSLDEHGSVVDLVDLRVPDYVWSGREGAYSIALSQYGERVRFPEVVTDEFYVLDDTGQLVEADLDVARRSEPPPPGQQCDGYRVDRREGAIVVGPVFGDVWRLRIEYTASAPTSATITRGESVIDTRLQPGTHVMEMPGGGAYDAVAVTPDDPGVSVCVHEVLVGTTSEGRPAGG